MSNFYKGSNASNGNYTRIIDNNSLMEEKLESLMQQMQKERRLAARKAGAEAEGEEGDELEFHEGIVPPSMEAFPEMELTYVESAKEEAGRIVSDATQEAEQILERAKEEAEALKERLCKEAEEAGYSQGTKRAAEEARILQGQMDQERQEFQRQYEERMDTMEKELVGVLCTVFERVFQIELSDRQDVLLALIQNTVQKVKNSKEYVLRVSEQDYGFVQEKKQEILQRIGGNLSLEILSDDAYQQGQCTIDTDTGIFDCSVDLELKNLIKEIRILSCMDGQDV